MACSPSHPPALYSSKLKPHSSLNGVLASYGSYDRYISIHFVHSAHCDRTRVDILVPLTGAISASQMEEHRGIFGPFSRLFEYCYLLVLHRVVATPLHNRIMERAGFRL